MHLPDVVVEALHRHFPRMAEVPPLATLLLSLVQERTNAGLLSAPGRPDLPPDKEIIAKIVERVDQPNPPKRDELRRLYAPGLPDASFNALWNEVRALRPGVSTSGPKKGSKRRL